MRTTTTTTARAVEPNAPHLDLGTVVDVIGGDYKGHIGRVRRYTAHRVVISLYSALGQAGSKKTKNKEATIKPSNIKARKLETEVDDEPSNIESTTSDDESLFLLAGLVALQIKKQQPDCTTRIIKDRFLKWVKEQSI
jgi:ribosomal protein L24